jgi:RNA recognition motif-containing protein
MDNNDEANKAIQELNGNVFKSREIIVNEAKPKKENY